MEDIDSQGCLLLAEEVGSGASWLLSIVWLFLVQGGNKILQACFASIFSGPVTWYGQTKNRVQQSKLLWHSFWTHSGYVGEEIFRNCSGIFEWRSEKSGCQTAGQGASRARLLPVETRLHMIKFLLTPLNLGHVGRASSLRRPMNIEDSFAFHSLCGIYPCAVYGRVGSRGERTRGCICLALHCHFSNFEERKQGVWPLFVWTNRWICNPGILGIRRHRFRGTDWRAGKFSPHNTYLLPRGWGSTVAGRDRDIFFVVNAINSGRILGHAPLHCWLGVQHYHQSHKICNLGCYRLGHECSEVGRLSWSRPYWETFFCRFSRRQKGRTSNRWLGLKASMDCLLLQLERGSRSICCCPWCSVVKAGQFLGMHGHLHSSRTDTVLKVGLHAVRFTSSHYPTFHMHTNAAIHTLWKIPWLHVHGWCGWKVLSFGQLAKFLCPTFFALVSGH